MNKTLTLSIDQNVVDSAENYAKHTEKSLAQLVEEYLLSLSTKNSVNNQPLGPITRQLAGIIKLEKNISHKELLANALTEKYL